MMFIRGSTFKLKKQNNKTRLFLCSSLAEYPQPQPFLSTLTRTLLYDAPGICPHTAFQIINKSTEYVGFFSCFLHSSAYPFVSVLPSNTNGNIFYKRSKIKLFQWCILSPFFFKKQLLSAKHNWEQRACCQVSAFPCFVSFAATDSTCWKVTCHSPKCLPSGPVAIPELAFHLFSLSHHDDFCFVWYPYRQCFKTQHTNTGLRTHCCI